MRGSHPPHRSFRINETLFPTSSPKRRRSSSKKAELKRTFWLSHHQPPTTNPPSAWSPARYSGRPSSTSYWLTMCNKGDTGLGWNETHHPSVVEVPWWGSSWAFRFVSNTDSQSRPKVHIRLDKAAARSLADGQSQLSAACSPPRLFQRHARQCGSKTPV
jgi:hypothetical protein